MEFEKGSFESLYWIGVYVCVCVDPKGTEQTNQNT